MQNKITCANGEDIFILTRNDVIDLHNLLSSHPEIVKILPEPISPKGIKNESNLDMAISRQTTGIDEFYKYPNKYKNCATLVYGVNKGHIFHNGNKRVSFLCMIMHLYKNGLVIKPDTSHTDIYSMLKSLASSQEELMNYAKSNINYKKYYRQIGYKSIWGVDETIEFLDRWIRFNTVSKNQILKPLRWERLFEKLSDFKISHRIEYSKGKATLILQEKDKSFFGILFQNRIRYTYAYSGDTCKVNIINNIRNDFNLTKDHGFDNIFFSTDERIFIDEELTTFKKLIYRLSLT